MTSFNQLILTGRVGGDPKIKEFENGRIQAAFSLATSDKWTDKESGKIKERTEWHRVVIFKKELIEKVIIPYVKKGDLLQVYGPLRSRHPKDEHGTPNEDVTIWELVINWDGGVVLFPKRDGKRQFPDADGPDDGANVRDYDRGDVSRETRDLDDEIPF